MPDNVKWLPEAVKEKLRWYAQNGTPTNELDEVVRQSLAYIEELEARLKG